MSSLQTFSVTAALVARKLAYSAFDSGTIPSEDTVTDEIEGVASEVNGVLRGLGFDPDTVATDAQAAEYCYRTILSGAAAAVADMLFAETETNRARRLHDEFLRRLSKLENHPAVLGESYSTSGQAHSVRTHDPDYPEGTSTVDYHYDVPRGTHGDHIW